MPSLTARSFEPSRSSVMPKASTFALFRDLPAEETERLEKLCSPQIFAPGEPLFLEGHPLNDIYLIQRGHVKFYKTSANQRHTVFNIFGEGDVFELLTSREKEIHLFSASAITETIVLSVTPKDFYRHFISSPGFASGLLCQKIRSLKRFYFSRLISAEPVEIRMAYFLWDLARHSGMAHLKGKTVQLDIPLTRRDVAEIVNTSVETSIRVMRKWIKRGWVTMDHRHLTIEDVAAFKKIIGKLPVIPD